LVRIGSGPREQSFKFGKFLRRRVSAFEPGSPFELPDEWIECTVGMVRRTKMAHRNVWIGLFEPLLER
jgi:hypothetical protein